MRKSGWYRVIHQFESKWAFAYFTKNHWEYKGENWDDLAFSKINEELQNPEPIKRTDFAGFVNPKKTGLGGDGHPIEVK